MRYALCRHVATLVYQVAYQAKLAEAMRTSVLLTRDLPGSLIRGIGGIPNRLCLPAEPPREEIEDLKSRSSWDSRFGSSPSFVYPSVALPTSE